MGHISATARLVDAFLRALMTTSRTAAIVGIEPAREPILGSTATCGPGQYLGRYLQLQGQRAFKRTEVRNPFEVGAGQLLQAMPLAGKVFAWCRRSGLVNCLWWTSTCSATRRVARPTRRWQAVALCITGAAKPSCHQTMRPHHSPVKPGSVSLPLLRWTCDHMAAPASMNADTIGRVAISRGQGPWPAWEAATPRRHRAGRLTCPTVSRRPYRGARCQQQPRRPHRDHLEGARVRASPR